LMHLNPLFVHRMVRKPMIMLFLSTVAIHTVIIHDMRGAS
jgi:hypothetical protein